MATTPAKKLATFGETASTPLASSSVRGDKRKLVLTQLTQTGPGSFDGTGVVFEFGRDNFTGPRGPQDFGLELRTSRQDLPGSEVPVEQVLGWNYTDFEVKGIWDDRHAGPGYAEETFRAFLKMVQQGKFVRYQFEQLTIVGIIKKFTCPYIRKEYRPYSFMFSPHFAYQGETVRVTPNSSRAIDTDPKNAVKKARASLEDLKTAQALATNASHARVAAQLRTPVFADVNSSIAVLEDYVSKSETLVNKDIFGTTENTTKALSRGAQLFKSARTEAASVISRMNSSRASAQLSIQSYAESLKFETWIRTVGGVTRDFVVQGEQSRRDFALRAQPKTQRLHRVRDGESLYQISQTYYGTPHHWREILATNHLSSLILNGGELLEIPEIKL